MINRTSTSAAIGSDAVRDDETGASLHVVIAHDDYAAHVRAMRMLAKLFLGRVDAGKLRLHAWRFEELDRELGRKRARADVPQAKVIVVSTSANGDLPEGVNLWLSDCLAVRRDTPAAVIALCEPLNDLEVPWRRLLRDAANAAGLDFLEVGAPVAMSAV